LTQRVDFLLNVVLAGVDPLEVERGLSHFGFKIGGLGKMDKKEDSASGDAWSDETEKSDAVVGTRSFCGRSCR
jgi:hypothetical protein